MPVNILSRDMTSEINEYTDLLELLDLTPAPNDSLFAVDKQDHQYVEKLLQYSLSSCLEFAILFIFFFLLLVILVHLLIVIS